MQSRHLSTVIRRDPAEVAAYFGNPENLPEWAAGLTDTAVRHDGDDLVIPTPMGDWRMRFAAPNDLGVLDHWVTDHTGQVTYNPVRVIAHPDGAELIFTLRQLNLTDEQYEKDAAAVTADLERLRTVLERD
ncbi:polyketide cyclase [Microbacterium mangrovi]|uniref:Polyketide cyclase n=1 Tax=Microbacterium mangrovi TaxID=1348253 RepID=A0A0B2A2R4_9MICO|nr:polyketide cyclase [Microbacterium mangrovi]KHK96104.1 polyketide cyclase [Microbacterium mangrovi]